MISLEFCRKMAQYNRWMNERQYDLCADLSDAGRKEDLRAPFRSIHGTLNHLLLADRIWMGRFLDEPERFLRESLPFSSLGQVSSLGQELYADFGHLRRARREMDDVIDGWAAGLTEDRLAGTLTFRGVTRPGTTAMPFWFTVQHFFNHQTHHRGQLTTLLEQAGCDCGVTDLLWLADSTP
jgi:uncharacterized damage-inducible protein DinB